jgi:hypothetical protein
MNYWIFRSNPERFRIDDRLKDPEPRTSWLVMRYRDEIKPGEGVEDRPGTFAGDRAPAAVGVEEDGAECPLAFAASW